MSNDCSVRSSKLTSGFYGVSAGGVLKSKIFGQKSTYSYGKFFQKFLQGMSVRQKLGIILESKVVQKLDIEKIFLPKNGLVS